MSFLEASPGLDPDKLVVAYCASQVALGQIPKNALAFGFELLEDRNVRLIFEMWEVTPEDQEDIESITGDLEANLNDMTAVSSETHILSFRTYVLPERAVEWLWSIHDSLSGG
jgi:hypothetical protein